MALKFLHAFLVLFLLHISVGIGLKCKVREREALLSLKQGFMDDYGQLSSWGSGENQQECCEWEGVVCSNRTGHVVKLDLGQMDDVGLGNKRSYSWGHLRGMISSSLAELRHLNHLDLSGNYFDVQIPEFIGSLTHLRYLNLSFAFNGGRVPNELGNLYRLQYLDLKLNNLHGEFPTQLSNLSCLKYLDLDGNYFTGTIPPQLGNLSLLHGLAIRGSAASDLEWLSYLSSSLTTLKLDGLDLSSAKSWLQLVSNLPHLRELLLVRLNDSLPDIVPLSIFDMNISKSLSVIDLSYNNLKSSIFAWLLNYKSSLQVLRLEGNLLRGIMPMSLWDICSLRELDLSDNKLSGQLHQNFPTYPHCAQKSLEILDLRWNQITGTMPDLSQFSSLRELWLGFNLIKGTLTKSIGQLSKLEVLSVRENALQGLITETHFLNLSKLQILALSSNSLVLNLSGDWVPPFQLEFLYLSSCKVGPYFPTWLRTQKSFSDLDLSNAEISDTVPRWFWNLPPWLNYLDLSDNQIRGQIQNLPVEFYGHPKISLSANLFHGPIPSFFSQAISVSLSYNNFSGASSLLCTDKAKDLAVLDLSNNQFTELPDCWTNLKSLVFLDLSNNHLSGQIPTAMGFLVNIQALHLHNNNLTGGIPASLNNCKELRVFDVGQNKLSGPIPLWIGHKLDKLLVIILRSNQFNGTLPQSLCFLSHTHILDLSLNNIGGCIPRCFKNLTAMSLLTHQSPTIGYIYDSEVGVGVSWEYTFDDTAWVTWKGKEFEYSSTLGLLRTIDLSSNNLVGEIPSEIMDLIGLVSLNISRNKLYGEIPSTVGQLKSLDFLDLSRNCLFGRIPSGLSQINRLSVLDLSYNNLSGKIPVSTQLQSFDAFSFSGNPELCGKPLPKTCPDEENHDSQNHVNDTDDNQISGRDFYISMAIGFTVGFWGVCFSLIFMRSWRYAYFKFLNDIHDWLYVLAVVNYVKVRRKFEGLEMRTVFRG